MNDGQHDVSAYLHSRFDGIEVIEGDYEVCLGEVCSEFGGCAHCKGLMLARELDAEGAQIGPARLFLCTHPCHENPLRQ